MTRRCGRPRTAPIDDKTFDEAVQVVTGEQGHTVMFVTNTRQAAEMLLYAWPVAGGAKHRTARQACLDVLAGQRKAAAARKAFRDAAEEADILVKPGMLSRKTVR